MEVVFTVSSLAGIASAVMLFVMILQCLSCAYVSRDIHDLKGKEHDPAKIYWSLNMVLQFVGTGLGAISLFVVHTYLK